MQVARHLYEIASDLDAIGCLLIDNGGDLTPEIEAKLEALDGEFEHKAERIALFARELERLSEGAKREADLMAKLAKGRAAAAERLKFYLLTTLQSLGRQKVETDRCRIRRQRNGQASVEIPNKAPLVLLGVATERTVVEYDVDKAALLEKWNSGEAGQRALVECGVTVEIREHLRIE